MIYWLVRIRWCGASSSFLAVFRVIQEMYLAASGCFWCQSVCGVTQGVGLNQYTLINHRLQNIVSFKMQKKKKYSADQDQFVI